MSEYSGGTAKTNTRNRSNPWFAKVNHYKVPRHRLCRQWVDPTKLPGRKTGALAIDGSTLPDPVLDGSVVSLQWDSNFQPDETDYTAAGDVQRDVVIAALATQAATLPTITSATVSGTTITMTPATGVTLTNGAIVVTPPPAPPPPPRSIFGPYQTSDGTPYWINAADWSAGFDIDTDPDPDVFIPLTTLLPLIPPAPADEIRQQAISLGWQEPSP